LTERSMASRTLAPSRRRSGRVRPSSFKTAVMASARAPWFTMLPRRETVLRCAGTAVCSYRHVEIARPAVWAKIVHLRTAMWSPCVSPGTVARNPRVIDHIITDHIRLPPPTPGRAPFQVGSAISLLPMGKACPKPQFFGRWLRRRAIATACGTGGLLAWTANLPA